LIGQFQPFVATRTKKTKQAIPKKTFHLHIKNVFRLPAGLKVGVDGDVD
jgi:hypothetical protein